MLKDILSQVVCSALSSAEGNDLRELSNARNQSAYYRGLERRRITREPKILVAQNVYGSRLKARIVSLLMRNFLSFSRASELALDYYQCKVSQGSI